MKKNENNDLFYIPERLLRMDKIRVNVIGVGGTGSHVVDMLASLGYALLHRSEKLLDVSAYDFDKIEDRNIGRSDFNIGDTGRMKTEVAINKANLGYGFSWNYRQPNHFIPASINILCLDTEQSREEYIQVINKAGEFNQHDANLLILDIGNDRDFGQVVMTDSKGKLKGLPKQMKTSEDLNTPTCSQMDWYMHQDLYINRVMAMWATQMLWKLFRDYSIDYNQLFWNSNLMKITTKLELNE